MSLGKTKETRELRRGKRNLIFFSDWLEMMVVLKGRTSDPLRAYMAGDLVEIGAIGGCECGLARGQAILPNYC
jgi:hypothetical protein